MRSSREAGNEANPVAMRPDGDEEGNYSTEEPKPTLPRKASSESTGARTQTDTGRQEENSKTLGRTLVKELGKITP